MRVLNSRSFNEVFLFRREEDFRTKYSHTLLSAEFQSFCEDKGMKEKLIESQINPLDELDLALGRVCQALHNTTTAATHEVWIDERQKMYLCQAHVDHFIQMTAVAVVDA
jgi:hypothetical protein